MILLTGGSGFVGKEIVRGLRAAGHKVRVLSRRACFPEKEGVEFFSGDVTRPETLKDCCRGVYAVIHLVGIIVEKKKFSFEDVHLRGTENILAEAKKSGVKRFLHMSAMNTRPNAASKYHQTKWAAEEMVRRSGLNWTIFRPSVIYGAEDQFTNMFARMARLSKGILPCIGDGKTILRPISVKETARCFIKSLANEETLHQTVDLCGPPLTFRQMLREIGRAQDCRHPLIASIPIPLARVLASVLEKVAPHPPLTRDQIIMLQEDQTGDSSSMENLFQFKPQSFADGVKLR